MSQPSKAALNETTQKNLWTKSEDIIGSFEIAAPQTLQENLSEIQETPVIPETINDSSSDSDEPEIIEEVIKKEQNAKVIQVNISAWQVTIWRFLQASNAFSFYRSKIILDRPNCFVPGQIILVRFKLDFSGLIFIIWTCSKWFKPNQNELHRSKMIVTWPKWFGLSKIVLDPQKDKASVTEGISFSFCRGDKNLNIIRRPEKVLAAHYFIWQHLKVFFFNLSPLLLIRVH